MAPRMEAPAERVLGTEMIKLLLLLIGLTMSFGLAAGVTISLAPAYADNVQAKGY